ncbi:MAG: YceI family protein [Balneolaceae bacterium]
MNFIQKFSSFMAVAVLAASSFAFMYLDVTSWSIDKSHSAINFKITHFFTPVNGAFNDYNATINFDPENLAESTIDVEIMVSSVDTKNSRRDGHLKTEDFFNAEKWPGITFKSSEIKSAGENEFVAVGTLTIKDVSQDIELPFTLLGVKDHPMRENFSVAGITASTTLDRTDFGVGTGDWASDAVVGDEVTIDLTLELNAEK